MLCLVSCSTTSWLHCRYVALPEGHDITTEDLENAVLSIYDLPNNKQKKRTGVYRALEIATGSHPILSRAFPDEPVLLLPRDAYRLAAALNVDTSTLPQPCKAALKSMKRSGVDPPVPLATHQTSKQLPSSTTPAPVPTKAAVVQHTAQWQNATFMIFTDKRKYNGVYLPIVRGPKGGLYVILSGRAKPAPLAKLRREGRVYEYLDANKISLGISTVVHGSGADCNTLAHAD